MSENAKAAFEVLQSEIGKDEGTGDWFEVTQEMVNQFADVTVDHQFIHVDPEAAKAGPFGTTIAHGFLTLSLLTHLSGSIKVDPGRFKGIIFGVNYGFDKVRFINPVKVGARIRCSAKLANAEMKGEDSIQFTRTMTIEIEGETKPALVADWITRATFG